METTHTQPQSYNFEIYTVHPVTKEEGWDIKFVSVFASSMSEAKKVLQTDVPLFDVIILYNYTVPMSEEEREIYVNGGSYSFTNHPMYL